MPNAYRAYPLSPQGKIAQPAYIIEAENDADAVATARHYVDGHDIEVWHGNKLLTTLSHLGGAERPHFAPPSPENCRARAVELQRAALRGGFERAWDRSGLAEILTVASDLTDAISVSV